jgi:ABC-type polysaccharide/polyol phosphate transport system ATPase subunit
MKGAILQLRRSRKERLRVLDDVSFTVEPGETVAVIGRNGAGKTSLLGVLAKIYRPTSGTVAVRGKVATLLELGAGFQPELTGLENVWLNATILGLSSAEIKKLLPSIVDFSELQAFIDAPVHTYSAGMTMRLGFSIAIHTQPDVLLIDEVLAVGDEAFQRKCYNKIAEFQQRMKTIIVVSHDLAAIRRVAPRVIWLDEGRLVADGPTGEILGRYLESVLDS